MIYADVSINNLLCQYRFYYKLMTLPLSKGRGYTVSIYFVDKLTSNDLLKRLKQKGLRNSDYTRAVIKDKLNDTVSML
jgi:hypothetical protein